LEDRKIGRLEEWKKGRKTGRKEDWKDGRKKNFGCRIAECGERAEERSNRGAGEKKISDFGFRIAEERFWISNFGCRIADLE